jgi:hypothetical protein
MIDLVLDLVLVPRDRNSDNRKDYEDDDEGRGRLAPAWPQCTFDQSRGPL